MACRVKRARFNFAQRFHPLLVAIALLTPALPATATIVDLSSNTDGWTPIRYSNNNPDPSNDQQTGSSEGDIVGIDANHDGAIDLFLGVNNSGAANTVGIWNPGAGLNVSP